MKKIPFLFLLRGLALIALPLPALAQNPLRIGPISVEPMLPSGTPTAEEQARLDKLTEALGIIDCLKENHDTPGEPAGPGGNPPAVPPNDKYKKAGDLVRDLLQDGRIYEITGGTNLGEGVTAEATHGKDPGPNGTPGKPAIAVDASDPTKSAAELAVDLMHEAEHAQRAEDANKDQDPATNPADQTSEPGLPADVKAGFNHIGMIKEDINRFCDMNKPPTNGSGGLACTKVSCSDIRNALGGAKAIWNKLKKKYPPGPEGQININLPQEMPLKDCLEMIADLEEEFDNGGTPCGCTP